MRYSFEPRDKGFFGLMFNFSIKFPNDIKLIHGNCTLLNITLKHYLYFIPGFSFPDTDNSQSSRRREETIFISHYHFQPLTNIKTFICSFACEMAIAYF